jgi:acyl-coenzyme A thioesterase PaaI-like protein
MNLKSIFKDAKASAIGRKKFNIIMARVIPFNKPHKLKVIKITESEVEVEIPYRKKNLNHLKGIHACALATGAEYCSGLMLLSRLGSEKYRLIMESIEVKYHYQAKSTCYAYFKLNDEELKAKILEPLESDGKVFYQCEIGVKDEEENAICTVRTNWQIKSWDKVKTKR